MNIHTALLRAADHIEQHPRLFNFDIAAIPPDCGTPGCALGWVNYFLNVQGASNKRGGYRITARPLFDDSNAYLPFYNRLSELVADVDGSWLHEASVCATALRRYAHMYHPETYHLAEAA